MKYLGLILLGLMLSSCASKTPEQQELLADDVSRSYIKRIAPDGCFFSLVSEEWYCVNKEWQKSLNESGITRKWMKDRINSFGKLHEQKVYYAITRVYDCHELNRRQLVCNIPFNTKLLRSTQGMFSETKHNDNGSVTYEVH